MKKFKDIIIVSHEDLKVLYASEKCHLRDLE